MNWRNETWRRLYVREEGSFAALPFTAKALAGQLLKICDTRGRIFPAEGEDIRDSICFRLGMTRGERRLNRPMVDKLLEDGYLVAGERGGVRIRNIARANPDIEDATTEQRTCIEPDANVSRPCTEECVKSAEPLEAPETPPVPALSHSLQIRSVQASPEADPDPERAIPDPVAEAWPEREPEPVRYHHAVVRYRAPAPACPWTPQRILDAFGRIRAEIVRGALPWHAAGRGMYRVASELVTSIERDPDAWPLIEETMRRWIERKRDSQDEKDQRVSWVFACWANTITELLEEVKGTRAPPPTLAGLTDKERKNLANTQIVFERLQRQEGKRP